ncbi:MULTISPECIES: flagellar biosynthetic protein FliO [unclassified Duganella]|uniref:flagellar biosynthetic protein FliO n=1 Tax=unclassified Duganella TaxID=2636909 RepID=UPI00088F1723|nr:MULTISPECIES: flagellar biosynthetic protein FliO [unclassified Duganella]SDG02700.1 flagellar protein FliO/FliZ [Duganella sp. OV458]SDJ02616.1 flagellar protein FliO/FliZ [Duganella sp. OV510]
MKHGLISSLLIAAALAAAPAMAQRTVSGTIGGAHAATPAAAAAPAQASPPAPATPPATAPAASEAGTTPAADEAAPAAAAPAPAPAPAAQPGAMAMTIPTPAPTPSAGGSLLQTSLALIFVIALMLGLAWLTKRINPRGLGGAGSNVKLVGTLSVGTRERILVVEVGEQWIVVGASPGRMNALATMPRQESSEPLQQATLPTANFAEWFKQTIDKRNGK